MKAVTIESNAREPISFAYMIYGNRCVFTAVQASCKGSSINMGENVAQTIADQEGVDLFQLRYFDLQTRASYTNTCLAKRPGEYEFEEIIVERYKFMGRPQLTIKNWLPAVCPAKVVRDFRVFLDETPKQVMAREDAVF